MNELTAEQKAATKNGHDTKSPAAPKPVSARRSWARPALVIGLIVAGLTGLIVWRAFLAAPTLPPGVIGVSGRIEGDDSAVAAKTAGRIREITVREGDAVVAGQVIATLDDQQIRAREQQAEAAVRQAEARVELAQHQITVLNEQLRQSELGVDQARQAESNEEAQAAIVAAASRQVEAARGSLTAARANLANPAIRTAQVAAVRGQILQARADIAAATADAQRARAQLDEARANRADLQVIAPFSGTVVTRTAEPGEVIMAGTPIITLLNLAEVCTSASRFRGQLS